MASVNAQKLRVLLATKGINKSELARLAAVSSSLISELASGKRKSTSLDTLSAIARVLDVPLPELLVVDVTPEVPPTLPLTELRQVPVIGTVPGGAPQLVEQQGGGTIYVDDAVLAKVRRPYALDVTGDSMFPGIHDGDFIVVDPDAIWAVGNVVVALVGSETTVKRIQLVAGRPQLVGDNGNGIIDPAGQDVHVVGVVVWVQPQGWKP